MNISHLKHIEIDKQLWDSCIANSQNRSIYAFSWYLDIVCPNWEALIFEDYLIVMPLCVGKKWSVKFLYQPFFTQQLGLFSKNDLSTEIVQQFLNIIASKYRIIDICLNKNNIFEINGFEVKKSNNHEIKLNNEYSKIFKNYNRNTKRNLKKGKSLIIKNTVEINKFAELFELNIGSQTEDLKPKHYELAKQLMNNLLDRGIGKIRGAYLEDGTLCAAGFFLVDNKQATFLICASTNIGKSNSAMFHIVDDFLHEYCQHDLIFDFSGSNLNGVAMFNSGFGAEVVVYPKIYKKRYI